MRETTLIPDSRSAQYGGVYLWYLLLLLLLAGAAALLLPVYRNVVKAENEQARYEEELRSRKEELAEVRSENQRLATPRGVEQVGREKYHLVAPGDTVLVYDLPKTRDARP